MNLVKRWNEIVNESNNQIALNESIDLYDNIKTMIYADKDTASDMLSKVFDVLVGYLSENSDTCAIISNTLDQLADVNEKGHEFIEALKNKIGYGK